MKAPLFHLLVLLVSALPLQAGYLQVNSNSGVPLAQAIRDAQVVASRNADWFVTLGQGTSMAPYYGEGSVLLVDRAPYNKLRAGMMVVFRDADGDTVGHWLVRQENGGWVTQGVNNVELDPELLTEANYQGVIFGVLNSRGADAEGLRVASQMQLPRVIGKSR